jgi:hypothetical protein
MGPYSVVNTAHVIHTCYCSWFCCFWNVMDLSFLLDCDDMYQVVGSRNKGTIAGPSSVYQQHERESYRLYTWQSYLGMTTPPPPPHFALQRNIGSLSSTQQSFADWLVNSHEISFFCFLFYHHVSSDKQYYYQEYYLLGCDTCSSVGI